ncbi:MAG: adenylyltransferase/cytidyltransferase family protein, partial [Candidatus Acidiferrales bacterium]
MNARDFRAGDLLGRVVTQDELMRHVAEEKRNGRRIVFTNGCYDLLHPGHIRLLESARELGDILILALNSDRSVRENKGANRPIISEAERAEVAAALAAVDYVVLVDEATPR